MAPNMSSRSKKQLLGASAMALRLSEKFPDLTISYESLHDRQKRGKPWQMIKYRLAIQLYKIYNGRLENDD